MLSLLVKIALIANRVFSIIYIKDRIKSESLLVKIALIANRVFSIIYIKDRIKSESLLVKIALIANRVFFKTLPKSVKTSFITKGHGQGALKRKNY